MDLQVIASIQHPTPLRRLRFHPTLPLLATVDACRLAVHVWTWRDGDLLRLASLGEPERERTAFSEDYSEWHDEWRMFDIAWHPAQPLLAVAGMGGVDLWRVEPEGDVAFVETRGIVPKEERSIEYVSSALRRPGCEDVETVASYEIRCVPPCYTYAGFSPSGESIWASPSYDLDGVERVGLREGWPWCSDWFAATAAERGGKHWCWDTDLALHPEGALVAAFESAQGVSLLKFASVLSGPGGERPQLLRRALELAGDGYENLVFSPRGDKFLFCGGACEEAFLCEFPSLHPIFDVACAPWEERDQGLSDEWHRYMWFACENYAFAPDDAGLLVGLHTGDLIDLDLVTREVRGRRKIHGKRLCSMRVRHRDGLLAVTDFEGLLRLYKLPHAAAQPDTSSCPLTAAFLASTGPALDRARREDLELVGADASVRVRLWERC